MIVIVQQGAAGLRQCYCGTDADRTSSSVATQTDNGFNCTTLASLCHPWLSLSLSPDGSPKPQLAAPLQEPVQRHSVRGLPLGGGVRGLVDQYTERHLVRLLQRQLQHRSGDGVFGCGKIQSSVSQSISFATSQIMAF